MTAMFDAPITTWLNRWSARLAPNASVSMLRCNPVYIPRNHLVEAALAAASAGDLAPFDELLAVVTDPFTERPEGERFAVPAPDGFTNGYQTFCGT